jgi:hypothetical protein
VRVARRQDGFTIVKTEFEKGRSRQASPIRFWCSVPSTDTDRSCVGAMLLRREAASDGGHGRDQQQVEMEFGSQGSPPTQTPPASEGLLGGSVEVCL